MLETWFIMEDGSVGDPMDIAPGDDGVLRHSDGRSVAYGPHGPRSRGCVDAEAERAKAAETKAKAEEDAKAAAKKKAAEPKDDAKREATSPEDREMKAEEPKAGYKTRAAKAD